MVRTTDGKNTYRWLELRENVFVRDRHRCVKCGFFKVKHKSTSKEKFEKYGKGYAQTIFKIETYGEELNRPSVRLTIGNGKYLRADHIVPIALGGKEWDINNLQTLCKKCHKKKTEEDIKEICKVRKNLKEEEDW